MRCLWISRDCPYPADSGDVIYGSRLLESFRDAGAEVTVLCRERDQPPGERRPVVLPGGIEWHVVTSKTRRGIGSLLTRSPNIGHRHNTTSMRLALSEELDREPDVVLLDHIGSGWALPMLRGHVTRHPTTKLVYLSQNHEASTRRLVAANAGGNPISRLVLRFDASKAARLEQAIVDESDLVTVVTADDAARFGADAPGTPCLVLSPGYLDRVVEARTITADLPRRAVIVGSFDWVAKRMNLEELLAEADDRFAAAGVELLVVGRGPDDWLAGLRGRTKATRFTGFVDSVIEHLDDARIGIVAERSGGGFKLKVLHYVFNRIPVAALAGSLAGVPLVAGESDLEAPTISALVDDVLRVIDDVDELNRLQRAAFDACRGEFDWATRGAELYATVRNLA
jgi:glycosyltransferase involved in cell wall biosynthesis